MGSRSAAKAWSWLLAEPWEPIICSMVAGVFLERHSGAVLWLDTGTGLIEQVAQDRGQFEEMLRSSPDLVNEWFLPPLVERLHAAGKVPKDGECYGFTFLPVFEEGKYDTQNMIVLTVREQFVAVADLHWQLRGVPDGSSVQINVTD